MNQDRISVVPPTYNLILNFSVLSCEQNFIIKIKCFSLIKYYQFFLQYWKWVGNLISLYWLHHTTFHQFCFSFSFVNATILRILMEQRGIGILSVVTRGRSTNRGKRKVMTLWSSVTKGRKKMTKKKRAT